MAFSEIKKLTPLLVNVDGQREVQRHKDGNTFVSPTMLNVFGFVFLHSVCFKKYCFPALLCLVKDNHVWKKTSLFTGMFMSGYINLPLNLSLQREDLIH